MMLGCRPPGVQSPLCAPTQSCRWQRPLSSASWRPLPEAPPGRPFAPSREARPLPVPSGPRATGHIMLRLPQAFGFGVGTARGADPQGAGTDFGALGIAQKLQMQAEAGVPLLLDPVRPWEVVAGVAEANWDGGCHSSGPRVPPSRHHGLFPAPWAVLAMGQPLGARPWSSRSRAGGAALLRPGPTPHAGPHCAPPGSGDDMHFPRAPCPHRQGTPCLTVTRRAAPTTGMSRLGHLQASGGIWSHPPVWGWAPLSDQWPLPGTHHMTT